MHPLQITLASTLLRQTLLHFWLHLSLCALTNVYSKHRSYTSAQRIFPKMSFLTFFFFNDTATTEIYTLSLHDALPISDVPFFLCGNSAWVEGIGEHITPLEQAHALPPQRFVVVKPEAGLETLSIFRDATLKRDHARSEEHTSELQSHFNLVCRLFL